MGDEPFSFTSEKGQAYDEVPPARFHAILENGMWASVGGLYPHAVLIKLSVPLGLWHSLRLLYWHMLVQAHTIEFRVACHDEFNDEITSKASKFLVKLFIPYKLTAVLAIF